MLNFYPFTLANSHVMLLLTAAITHGITEDPQEKSCLFSVSVYGWRLYQVDAINQFRHMIKTKGLKRPINLFRCVPCPTFTTHFSSSIYVGLNSAPSLSSVLFVVFRIFSHLPSVLKYTLVFCNQYLSFAVFTCVCLCVHQGMYALSYHHGYASHILPFVLAICICLLSQVQVCSIRVMAAPPPIDSKPQPAEPEARSATRGKSICRD